MTEIIAVHARGALDARGRPAVEVEVRTDEGEGVASVSCAAEEAEARGRRGRRTGDPGLASRREVEVVNQTLGPSIVGMGAVDQSEVDRVLEEAAGDGREAGAIAGALLGVSVAVARATAAALGLPLWRYLGGVQAAFVPVPRVALARGDWPGGGGIVLREVSLVAAGVASVEEAIATASEVRGALVRGAGVTATGGSCADAACMGPGVASAEDALRAVAAAVEAACCAGRVGLAIQVAKAGEVSAADLAAACGRWCASFPILSVAGSDLAADREGWGALAAQLPPAVLVVADGASVLAEDQRWGGTRSARRLGASVDVARARTVTRTLRVVGEVTRAGHECLLGCGDGVTLDAFVADVAVATNAGLVDVGSLAGAYGIALCNQLGRIAYELGGGAVYAGRRVWPERPTGA